MTNAEKHKTAKERRDAFWSFCVSKWRNGACLTCPVNNCDHVKMVWCVLLWLELEAEEVRDGE